MAYSELPWRPFLGHQAWSWTTLRRGNVFLSLQTSFYVFNVFKIFIWTFLHLCYAPQPAPFCTRSTNRLKLGYNRCIRNVLLPARVCRPGRHTAKLSVSPLSRYSGMSDCRRRRAVFVWNWCRTRMNSEPTADRPPARCFWDRCGVVQAYQRTRTAFSSVRLGSLMFARCYSRRPSRVRLITSISSAEVELYLQFSTETVQRQFTVADRGRKPFSADWSSDSKTSLI